MIEISRDALLQAFYDQAEGFLSNPGVRNGMAFDDAVVKLKRWIKSEQPERTLISQLNGFAGLIRNKDLDTLASHIEEIRQQLAASDS